MDKLTYQQARYVRNKSFSDLLAGQIAAGGGVFSSAKKVVGLKTKAKITGIKEKFDPLNIIKFMTGGSNLAPALLGRLLGRSQKDIQNFAGGSRLAGIDKKTKIGPAPSEDTSGITEVLQKIYSFMKGSQEAETLRREKENNFKEEKAMEDERRHKQLLKALQNALGGGGGGGKASKQSDGGSWWDNIKAALEVSWKAISKFFGWVGKLFSGLINKVKTVAKSLWNGIKSFGSMIWEKISSAISSILTPIIEKLRAWFPQTMEAASKGIEKLKGVGEKLFPKSAAKTEAKVAEEVAEKATSRIIWKGIPIIGIGAGLFFGAERAMAGDWIGAGLEVAGGAVGGTLGLPAELALGVGTAAYEANFDAENGGESESPTATPLPPTGAGAGRGTAESAASDPRRVDREPASAAVTTSSNENRNLQIEAKASDGASTSVTNNTVTTPTSKPQNDTLNASIPIVRNIEDTFSRLLYNSTRVV